MITMDFVIGVISLVATIFGIGYSVEIGRAHV